MSAFMHGTAHVDAVIHGILTHAERAVVYGNPARDARDNPTRAGRVLLHENAESVAYRYNMKDLDNGGTLPIEYLGYVEQAESYEYDPSRPRKHYSAAEILLALHSIEHQSCERPDFRESEAYSLIRAAERALISAIPDYARAQTWAITESED